MPNLRTPLVFVPGSSFLHSQLGGEYFHGISKFMALDGREFYVATLPKRRTIEDRSRALAEQVSERLGTREIELVPHRSGGPDARHYVSQLGGHKQVKRLTTLGTPHRGMQLIPFWQEVLPASVVRAFKRGCEKNGGTFETFSELSPEYLQQVFNPACPNHPDVQYRSIVAVTPRFSQCSPYLWLTRKIVEKLEGPNDGFVSSASAQWGESIDTIQADHFSLVGHPFGIGIGIDLHHHYLRVTGAV